ARCAPTGSSLDRMRPLPAFLTSPPPGSTLFPYTTLFRSGVVDVQRAEPLAADDPVELLDHLGQRLGGADVVAGGQQVAGVEADRSEEHTSELQSRFDLVCRLLLEKKKSPELVDPALPRRT